MTGSGRGEGGGGREEEEREGGEKEGGQEVEQEVYALRGGSGRGRVRGVSPCLVGQRMRHAGPPGGAEGCI